MIGYVIVDAEDLDEAFSDIYNYQLDDLVVEKDMGFEPFDGEYYE